MKFIKTFAVLALFIAANTVSAQSALDKWPAMKDFHEVMSRTFHPAEEGNFEPARNYSETLMNKAMELTKSEIPKELRTKTIADAIARLQVKTAQVHKEVLSKASDAVLKKSLSEAHDIFHEIIGLCSEKH